MNLINLTKPKINKIYKLRKNQLLYPEGIVTLNDSAYKVLSLCDGERSIPEIKDFIIKEYNFDESINKDLDEVFLLFFY